MPRLHTYRGFVFFFYSNDHPYHIHVRKDGAEVKIYFKKEGEACLKIEKLTSIKFKKRELTLISKIVIEKRDDFILGWDLFLKGKKP
ncbi:MAG: DUF4160 domain-containing protein [Chitinophagaceae bacterium]|nr:DUF4160 domain-containing protein [Chitinophagaceae bacterium]